MASEFEQRLQHAIDRGTARAKARDQADREKELTEAELKSLHSQYRLVLSEHVEANVEKLVGYFPGFRFETVYGERWGAACFRDDFVPGTGTGGKGKKRRTDYSRLEMTVRPPSSLQVLELTSKGTVRNKEVFNRTYFKKIVEVDTAEFERLVDAWVIEYAELYAAAN